MSCPVEHVLLCQRRQTGHVTTGHQQGIFAKHVLLMACFWMKTCPVVGQQGMFWDVLFGGFAQQDISMHC